MVGAARALGDAQGPLIQGAGVEKPREILVADREIVEQHGELAMIGAKGPFGERDGAAQHTRGLAVAPSFRQASRPRAQRIKARPRGPA